MPSRGVNRASRLRWRNMAQRSWAASSLSEKYQWPEEGRDRFEISPSATAPAGRAPAASRASRFRRDGV